MDEIRGDGKYNNRTLDRYLKAANVNYKVTVVERPAGVKGLVHLPYRWVVERTNAWNGKYRRNSKDYERTTSSSEAMIKVSTIHLITTPLAAQPKHHGSEIHLCTESHEKSGVTFRIDSYSNNVPWAGQLKKVRYFVRCNRYSSDVIFMM